MIGSLYIVPAENRLISWSRDCSILAAQFEITRCLHDIEVISKTLIEENLMYVYDQACDCSG